MTAGNAKHISRRQFLKTAGATALTAGAGSAVIIPGRAQPRTLKILTLPSFMPNYDQWLTAYAKDWGDQNNIHVVIDFVDWDAHEALVRKESATQQGHDIIDISSFSPEVYYEHIIDHREIYEECERRYGKPLDVAIRSSYSPLENKYFGFCQEYFLHLVIYRQDLWDGIDMVPETWENIRLGGRRIKLFHDHPVGISLSPQAHPDSERVLRALLYSFGASVQNADNRPALRSKQALEALKFVKALYEEAMSEDVLNWGLMSNNQSMLSGEGSLTLNPLNLIRVAEKKQFPISDQLLSLAQIPAGPVQRLAPAGITLMGIWQFANNVGDAKRFLVDYTGHSHGAFLASEYFNLPSFPNTIPNMSELLSKDAEAKPANKYQLLADAENWVTNRGYPGFDNLAVLDIRNTGLIPTMFANAATGKMTPEEAMIQADQEVRKIYDKWRALGKV